MASIRKISLLLRLIVAGPSVLSGGSARAIERLLEGRVPEKRIQSLNILDPRPPTSRLGIRQKERNSATLLFFQGLERRKLFSEQILREQVVIDH